VFASEAFAVGAAVCIAVSGMLISELRGRVDVIRLARWQMLCAFAMTAAGSLATGGWRGVEAWQLALLGISSLFGIVIASTTYFAAIYTAGPRNTALLFSLASPFALALGYIVLGETINCTQAAGIALVLAGIVLAIGGPKRSMAAEATHRSANVALLGIVLGVITALGQAAGSLAARPAMASGIEPFTAMAIRAGMAAGFFIVLALVPLRFLHRDYLFSYRDFGIAAACAFFGTALGMSLLMAALATGDVGIVSTLSSMTPVVILPMVWIRTKVAPPPRAWAGAVLAVAGTALISLG